MFKVGDNKRHHTLRALGPLLALSLVLSSVSSSFSFPASVFADLSDTPIPWSNFTFIPVTYNGGVIYDYESSADPSRGPGAVSPANIDISSCSPNGYLPGNQPSFLYAYYDGGTPFDVSDDHLALRMRLNGTPLEQSGVGLDSGHWYILIDIDNDGYKEFAIDIDGTVFSNRPDRVYLLYNNLPTNNVTPRSVAHRQSSDVLGGDEIGVWYAAGPAATGTAQTNNHIRVLTATPTCYGGTEYWLDVQLPISAFKVGGMQLLDNTTPARFHVSTSASAVDPLQKDWMLKVYSDPIFSDTWQPIVYASKTATLLQDNDGNGAPSPGDVLRYDITITNSGLLNMLNVVFYDKITDPNLQLVDNSVTTSPGGTIVKQSGNEVEVYFISIAYGTSATVSFRVTILFPEIPGVSVVSNQGQVSGSNFTTVLTDDPSTPTPYDATRTTLVIPPTLRITKEGPDEVNPGSNITFTGTLTNYGTQPAYNVVLVDYLPAGLSFVSSSHAAVYNPVLNTITWNLGTLPGGVSIPGWVAVHVSDNISDNTTLTNLFSVTWQGGGPATATKDMTVRAYPLLSISKYGPPTATAGSLLTYTGTLTNYGTVAADNVTLVDILPTGLSFVSSSHGAVYDPGTNTITWSLGTVNAGVFIPGWVTVQVDSGIANGTTLTDTFSLTWEDGSGNSYGPVTASANTTIYTAPHLTITKEGPTQVTAGSYLTFTGTLTNVGGSAAENVVLVDYLPPGLTFVASSHTAVYDPYARTITWNLGTVGSGVAIPGWVTVHVDGNIPDGTLLRNLFSVTWQGGGPAEATKDVLVRTSPLLTVSKTGPAYGSPGSLLTFTLTVTNSGGLDAYNVNLVDVLSDNYTYVSSIPSGMLSNGNVVWNLGTLTAGNSTSVSVTVSVNDGVANATTLIDTALAMWQDEQGMDYGPAVDILSTTIYTIPHLVIAKTGPELANPGDYCTYTITVTNTSSTDATNVVLMDYVSDNMTYVSSSDGGSHTGGVVTWNLGAIAGGTSRSVTITLQVNPTLNVEKILTDVAVVAWQDAQSDSYGPVGVAAQTRVCPFPLLSIDIAGPVTGEPCDTLTFTIGVSNNSSAINAQNVTVQYVLPYGASYVSSSDGGIYDSGVVLWNLGTLTAGSYREVTVTITYCVLPVGAEVISTAGMLWQCPAGVTKGPAFDTTSTLIVASPQPPPEPEPSEQPTLVTVPVRPPTPQPRPSGLMPPPGSTQPPSFTVTDLTVQVSARTQLICAQIYNSGGPGGGTVSLKINGVVEGTKPVTLGERSSVRVCWRVSKTTPGNYLVEVEGRRVWFTVKGVGADTLAVVIAAAGLMGLFIAVLISLIVIIYRRMW